MIALRSALYLVLVGGLAQAMLVLSRRYEPHWFFTEHGPVEWVQFGVLVACAGLLFLSSRRGAFARELSVTLTVLPLAGTARELDSVLKAAVHESAHTAISVACIAFAAGYAWRFRERIAAQASFVMRSHAFGLLLCAFITVMAYSRIMGQQRFWAGVYSDDTHRLTGRIVEESTELYGYLLLLFGCVEYWLLTRSSREDRKDAGAGAAAGDQMP